MNEISRMNFGLYNLCWSS